MDLATGLASLAFWGFISAVVVVGVYGRDVAAGAVDLAEITMDIMNVLSLRFFDACVRGTAAPALEPDGFPELSTRTNLP